MRQMHVPYDCLVGVSHVLITYTNTESAYSCYNWNNGLVFLLHVKGDERNMYHIFYASQNHMSIYMPKYSHTIKT